MDHFKVLPNFPILMKGSIRNRLSPNDSFLSPSLSSSSSMSIISDPTSASSVTTFRTPSPQTTSQASMLLAYDQIINTKLAAYLKASSSLGDPVRTQSIMVESLFHSQRSFLRASCSGRMSSTESGPSQAVRIQQIQQFAADQVTVLYWTIWIQPDKTVCYGSGNLYVL